MKTFVRLEQATSVLKLVLFLLTAWNSWPATDVHVQATVKSTGKSVNLVWL